MHLFLRNKFCIVAHFFRSAAIGQEIHYWFPSHLTCYNSFSCCNTADTENVGFFILVVKCVQTSTCHRLILAIILEHAIPTQDKKHLHLKTCYAQALLALHQRFFKIHKEHFRASRSSKQHQHQFTDVD